MILHAICPPRYKLLNHLYFMKGTRSQLCKKTIKRGLNGKCPTPKKLLFMCSETQITLSELSSLFMKSSNLTWTFFQTLKNTLIEILLGSSFMIKIGNVLYIGVA